MVNHRLKYVKRVVDRYGKSRFYFRRRGFSLIALPDPDEQGFWLAYEEALSRTGEQPKKAPVVKPRTLEHLIDKWQASPAFMQMAYSTRQTYGRILLNMQRQDYAGHLVENFKSRHIRSIIERHAETPAAANSRLKLFRCLFGYARKLEWCEDSPAQNVERFKTREAGARSWTDEEISRYWGFYPQGSRERLAMALLLYTGQRRSDIVRLSWNNIEGDYLVFVQQKTGRELTIRIHPALGAELALCTRQYETFLHTGSGRPFTPNGFYMRFRAWRQAAGLPDGLSPHGMRKATARRLAEAGCTPHQIASITGHASLAEVQRYTRQADQKRMAEEVISKL